MPTISVIIPVYNGGKTIARTIASVLNQTYRDLELIVINDGSTDNTAEVVAGMADPRLHLFSYANRGLSTSRNRGTERATGDYLSFIDADDLWTPDKLAAQLQALLDHPQAAVAYSWTDYIDEDDRLLHTGHHMTVNGNVYQQLLLRDFIESGSNILVRRQVLAAVGGFDPELVYGEDWDMWLRLAASYEFVAVPRPQVFYRISSGSISSNTQRVEAAVLRVLELNLARAPEIVTPIKRQILAENYQYLTYRTLKGPLGRQQGFLALRFFCLGVWLQPTWLKRQRLVAILLLKIVLSILLPSTQANHLFGRIKQMDQLQAG